MKTITINLPDEFQVPGMLGAPENLRVIPTDKWDEEFCLAAITHGVKQPQQDTWRVGRKDLAEIEKQ